MPTSRRYGDACPVARALDLVGERWALLVVRELLLGPQRFSDLRRALPGASSNLLTDRLRELSGSGVIRRRKLSPPAASWVYELTDRGRELEPVISALGAWGARVPPPPPPATISAASILLYLRGAGRPDPQALPMVCHLELDQRVWTVRVEAGEVHVDPDQSGRPEFVLRTDPVTLNALLAAPATLDHALQDGRATATGDLAALRRLLHAVADT